MKYIIIFTLMTTQVWAKDEPVKHLNSGEKAPYEGYLFVPSRAERVRELKIDYDSQTKVIKALNEENEFYKTRLKNAREDVSYLLEQKKETGFLTKAGFFLAGALVTGFIAYGTTRIIK